MPKTDLITKLLQENNGYIKMSDANENNISMYYLQKYINEHNLMRVAHGIYITQETWEDSLYVIQVRYPKIIFSHEVSAYLLGLSDREPMNITLTMQADSSFTRLNKKGVKTFKVQSELFEIGLVSLKTTYGNTVRSYNAERTICDYPRNKVEAQKFQSFIKSYMRSKNKNISLLMQYAKEF